MMRDLMTLFRSALWRLDRLIHKRPKYTPRKCR